MTEHESRLPEHPSISEQAAREIDNFAEEVRRFQQGELSPERFRAFRLSHGIYGQRQAGVQMVRVKIPAGALNGRQLRRLADIAQEFSPTGLSHLTTRQDIQFHYVPMERVPHLLRLLAEVGLTTREACGNSVRNVTACPLTGYIADELFDVRPYAIATYEYLVRNPLAQQLARKFKIAFSSCPEDCASTAIHDIGFVGKVREESGRPRYGFAVIIGGGLGSTPFTAETLEEFMPLEDLLITVKGIIKVFSDYGNRRNKMKARLKFVVHKLGIAAFRTKVGEAVAEFTNEERREADLFRYVPAEDAGAVARRLSVRFTNGWSAAGSLAAAFERLRLRAEPASPDSFTGAGLNKGICGAVPLPAGASAPFMRWQSASVRRHKDSERAVVTVAVPLGDVDPPRLRAFANLVTAYAADEARIAINQNFVLPNVPRSLLGELYEGLSAHGFAEASIGTALDVTSCPGADTCGLGITSSKGLARAIRSELLPMAENGAAGALRDVTIKVSGCPNSCGQHHVANIGFHGVVKKVNGKQIPAYQLHLGGRIGQGNARIGDALDKIPARAVPKAIAALLQLFQAEREGKELFADFVVRYPREAIEAVLKPFADDVPSGDVSAVDWGQDSPFSTEEIGTGECAGAGTDIAVNPFDNYEAELLQTSLFMERGQWIDALANLNRSQYTLARIFLDKLGKHPDSDYETACELRAQIIDRGYLGEMWNKMQTRIADRLRSRTPDLPAVRALYASALDLLEESKLALPAVEARKAAAAAEFPGLERSGRRTGASGKGDDRTTAGSIASGMEHIPGGSMSANGEIEGQILELEAKSAEEALTWALGKFHPRIAFASSFGVEDVVVIDMLARIRKDARIFTLDTGRLHEETYEVMERIRTHYGVTIESYFPDRERVEGLERGKGLYSFRESIENRKECCFIRKVEPLNRALAGLDVWISGLRREQAVTRGEITKLEVDPSHPGMLKLNPIADWTLDRVWDYIRKHDIPYNALHDRGFPSIGCSPCARAVQPGEDIRAGRWWWELPEQKECGLHATHPAAAGVAAGAGAELPHSGGSRSPHTPDSARLPLPPSASERKSPRLTVAVDGGEAAAS